MTIVTAQILSFVQRMVPVRFGIVPMLGSDAAIQQAKVVYHLQEAYGVAAVAKYLELVSVDNAQGEARLTPLVD